MTGTEMLFFAVTVYIAILGPILVAQVRYPMEEPAEAAPTAA